jgi:hypothetical protein
MKVQTKEIIEASGIALSVAALLWFVLRDKTVPTIVASTADQPENIPINHAGESGGDYFNYNYPAVQGITVDLSHANGSATTGCPSPTCGCATSQLLGTNAEFQRYLQERLTGFVDTYTENILTFLPTWYKQYLYITGPGLSHLTALELDSVGNDAGPAPFYIGGSNPRSTYTLAGR